MGQRRKEKGLCGQHLPQRSKALTPRCPWGHGVPGHLSTVRVGSGAAVWGELEGIMISQYGQEALQGKIKGVSI